jgi:protoheme ferro-lyase
VECGRPESKEAVRSFLGMTGYLDNFTPKHVAITAPLRKLTKKKNSNGERNKKKSFKKLKEKIAKATTNKLKEEIARATAMRYFDPRLPNTNHAEN